jgi:hypothetical protein
VDACCNAQIERPPFTDSKGKAHLRGVSPRAQAVMRIFQRDSACATLKTIVALGKK